MVLDFYLDKFVLSFRSITGIRTQWTNQKRLEMKHILLPHDRTGLIVNSRMVMLNGAYRKTFYWDYYP